MNRPLPDAALERHVAILGKTGSGKSNLAKVIAEGLLADGARTCIIDPTGTWFGIRLDRSGNRASPYPVAIFGGQHADLQIRDTHGAAIAEAVGTASSSAIIDTRLMTVGERTRFFADFAEALLRKNRGPLHVIIDEAHLFMPQGKVNDPQSGKMLHAGNNLVSLGRGNGLRIIMISQRPAKVHKDSLTQIETLVAMRLIAPQDRNAINDWIGEWADPKEGKDLIASLPSLKTGDGWIWSPELGILRRDHFPLAATFDSGKPGAGHGPTLAPIDIEAIATKLESIAAETKANDPKVLKARIAELEREAARPRVTGADVAQAIQDAEQRGYDRAFQMGVRALSDFMCEGHKIVLGAEAAVETLKEWILSVFNAVEGRAEDSPSLFDASAADWDRAGALPLRPAPPAVATRAAEAPRQLAPSPAKPPAGRSTHPDVTPARHRILDALAWMESLGNAQASREMLAFLADASPGSSAYANNLGGLRTAGLVDYPGPGTIALTDAGRAIASRPPDALTHQAIMERVRAKLSPAQTRILDVAASAYPKPLAKDRVADLVDASASSSAFANNLGRLRTLGLITYPASGQVRADDRLFP